MYSLSVAMANLPTESLAPAAELAAAAAELAEAPLLPLLEALVVFLRVPTTTPTTIATIAMMRIGTPNFIRLLVDFLAGFGVMYPDD